MPQQTAANAWPTPAMQFHFQPDFWRTLQQQWTVAKINATRSQQASAKSATPASQHIRKWRLQVALGSFAIFSKRQLQQ